MAAREPSEPERTTPAGAGRPERARSARAEQAERATSAGSGTPPATSPLPTDSRNRLGWIAVAVAGVLLSWQVVYALTAPTASSPDTYESVSLLLTLVLSVGAIVLGVVALGQRVTPRWPATAATAVGAFAFVICVATWIGTLMT